MNQNMIEKVNAMGERFFIASPNLGDNLSAATWWISHRESIKQMMPEDNNTRLGYLRVWQHIDLWVRETIDFFSKS